MAYEVTISIQGEPVSYEEYWQTEFQYSTIVDDKINSIEFIEDM